MRRWMVKAAAAAMAVAMTAACGDDFEVNEFPRIEVAVEGDPVDEAGGEVRFTTALQSSIDMTVRITNPGNKPLVVSKVAWEVDELTGVTAKNEYVTLSGQPVGSTTVSHTDGFGLTFKVRYTPPLGKALDDFSSSVLIIESNARDRANKKNIDRIAITFSMPEDRAYPEISPNPYTFQNATPTKPEQQTFFITNDTELATTSFQVTGIRLAKSSDEFTLLDLPNLPATVAKPDPILGSVPVTFKVQYRPVDEGNDTNTLVVETDQGTFNVPLSSSFNPGGYSVSYSHVDLFDFSNVNAIDVRNVSVLSEGPGVLAIKEPRIEPAEANDVFSFKVLKPATKPDEEPSEITKFPQAFAAGKSFEIEVTYAPGADPTKSPNGRLIVPYTAPDSGEMVFELWAGTPKPLVSIAPFTKLVAVNADAASGATGTRNVVVYNYGNGALTVNDVTMQGSSDLTKRVFDLTNKPAADTVVPPGGALVLEVAWDASKYAPQNLDEFLHVHYIHGFTGEATSETVALVFYDDPGVPPTAVAGPEAGYAGTVGEELTLDGSGSTGGDFTLGANSYLWYLTDLPAGSRARLNVENGPFPSFVPDVAGSYTVELVVYAVDSATSDFLTSAPHSVTVDVQAAP